MNALYKLPFREGSSFGLATPSGFADKQTTTQWRSGDSVVNLSIKFSRNSKQFYVKNSEGRYISDINDAVMRKHSLKLKKKL